ncbi:MAG: hypothetical protein UD936_00715, partial [Acutalibacteraceae bacterium]|nr:hypothetical protein [Acutalibacteraceae bacterium]
MSNDNKELFGEDNSFESEKPLMGFDENEPEEEYTSQFDELEEFLEDYDNVSSGEITPAENTSKGLSTKSTAIIAVVAVLLVAVIALAAYFIFFNKSIKSGVWVPVNLDEATQEYVEIDEEGVKQYYKFTNSEMIYAYGNEYAASYSQSTIELESDKFVMKDSSNLILNYEVTGNVFKGKYLTLIMAGYDDQPLTYKWKFSVKMPKHKGPEFKKNDDIL